jgi:hypothetical protein
MRYVHVERVCRFKTACVLISIAGRHYKRLHQPTGSKPLPDDTLALCYLSGCWYPQCHLVLWYVCPELISRVYRHLWLHTRSEKKVFGSTWLNSDRLIARSRQSRSSVVCGLSREGFGGDHAEFGARRRDQRLGCGEGRVLAVHARLR